jgi:hypothetical protein
MGTLVVLPNLALAHDDRDRGVYLGPRVLLDVDVSKVLWAPRVKGHIHDVR